MPLLRASPDGIATIAATAAAIVLWVAVCVCSIRSGKLTVLAKVLAAWHAEGHKVLLFTQTQQMLDILEKLAVAAGYSYHRMDGSTPITQRGRLMDDFNNNPSRCVAKVLAYARPACYAVLSRGAGGCRSATVTLFKELLQCRQASEATGCSPDPARQCAVD